MPYKKQGTIAGNIHNSGPKFSMVSFGQPLKINNEEIVKKIERERLEKLCEQAEKLKKQLA